MNKQLFLFNQNKSASLSWQDILASEKKKPYFKKIMAYLNQRINNGAIIYPPKNKIFNAIKLTPFDKIKAVIIGQDPYHGKNQAHGLCFSVQKGIPLPPSLKNIFKELVDDLKVSYPLNGDLTKWAKEGVLLLNAILTVEAGKPASHRGIGWEHLTDFIISAISKHKKNIVFILWGAFAQKKSCLIDKNKHFILTAPHPSPFSANRGFLGCKHFSKTNKILTANNISPIDWDLTTPYQ